MGRAVDTLDGVSSVAVVIHACIYDIVVLHNVTCLTCSQLELKSVMSGCRKLPVLFSKMYLCNKMYF